MKLSALIPVLNDLLASEGDIPVFLQDLEGSTIMEELDTIEFKLSFDGLKDGNFSDGFPIVLLGPVSNVI